MSISLIFWYLIFFIKCVLSYILIILFYFIYLIITFYSIKNKNTGLLNIPRLNNAVQRSIFCGCGGIYISMRPVHRLNYCSQDASMWDWGVHLPSLGWHDLDSRRSKINDTHTCWNGCQNTLLLAVLKGQYGSKKGRRNSAKMSCCSTFLSEKHIHLENCC